MADPLYQTGVETAGGRPRVRRTTSEWKDLIEQAIDYKKDFGHSDDWQRFRGYMRGDFGLTSDELDYNITYAIGRAMIPNIYFRNPYITVSPRFKTGLDMQAKIVEAVDNWLIQEMNFKKQMKKAIHHAFLCGRGFLKLGYDSQFGFSAGDVLAQDGVNDATATQRARGKSHREMIEYNACINPGMPWIKSIDPDHMLVPFGSGDEDEMEWMIHIIVRQLEDAKRDKKYNGLRDINGTHLNRMLKNSNKRKLYQDFSKHIQWLEIFEIHDARFKEISAMIEEGNGTFIRGPQEDALQIDGLPFVSIAFNEDTEYFWCTPDAAIMESQQKEMNESRTQTQRHRRLALLKFLIEAQGMTLDEADKMLAPDAGAVAFTRGKPGDIVSILQPHIPPDIVQWGDVVRGDVRELFGTGRNQLGEESGSSRMTATESEIIKSAHALRMDERRDIVADATEKCMRRTNQIIAKLWDTERVVQVVGYDGASYWVRYNNDQLKGEHDLKIDVESLTPTTKEGKKKDILTLMQAMQNNPMALNYLMSQLSKEYSWLDATKMFPEGAPGQVQSAQQFAGQQQKMMTDGGARRGAVQSNMAKMKKTL